MDNNIFLQISALLGITVSVAFVIKLLRQPLMVAYIVAGIASGPLFLNVLNGDSHMYDAFAQFGIVLLLFILGLNLNFNHLGRIGLVSAVAGLGQVLFTFVIGLFLLLLMEFSLLTASYLALAITFSSTIIIVKLLNDKNDTDTTYGKYTIGLMLVQDVVAIFVLIAMSTLTAGNSFLSAAGILVLKGLALGFLLYLISKYLLPRILDRIANNGEFLFIFTIAWCFGIASMVNLSGFSIEIGAVAAGLTLGTSPYQTGIISRIKPLRDFFIVLFFIILGSEMGLANFDTVLLPGAILSLFILVGNPIILYVIFRQFKFTRRNSFLAGVTAAQVSEFGFILVFTGQMMGHIGGEVLPIFTMVALVTIFISSYLITYNKQLFRLLRPIFNLFGKDRHTQMRERAPRYDVWVFGNHRIGWKICETLKKMEVNFAVVDCSHQAISNLKRQNIPAFFGDVSDIDFLEMLPLEKSKLIISTFPDPDGQSTFINYVKSLNKKVHIISNLNHNMYLDDLYAAGSDYVLMPHLLGGHWIADILKKNKWTKTKFKELRKEQEQEIEARRKSLQQET